MVSDVDTTTSSAPDFDPDALREKYRAERDKRIRKDANAQYVEVAGAFAPYLHDPYTEQADRPPLTDDVTVAIIGGGFAGLITGARLRQAGIDDFRVIEKGGDFGGTWYWNRYPGAQCDVESYVYLPLLEETSYVVLAMIDGESTVESIVNMLAIPRASALAILRELRSHGVIEFREPE